MRLQLCLRWSVAVAAAAALCACSQSSQQARTAATPAAENPCRYVTAADVSAAVGGPMGEGRLSNENPAWNNDPACLFTPRATFPVDLPGGSNAMVLFARVTFLDPATYLRLIARPTPFASSRPVSGFGDEAYEVAAPHYEVLFVRRGAYRVAFEVEAGLGSFFPPEERLAAVVVPRLPA